ncbi:MAG: slipin family protein [Nitriliruptoraceae bacterium]|nr:slipin family protein [Nitriliruptoraceae bacterium]
MVALVLLLAVVVAAVRIVPEPYIAVVFRLGKVIGTKGPGLFFIIPFIDQVTRVNLQTVAMDIPPQDIITKDNVTVRVNAVTYFNVTDAIRATLRVQRYAFATSQIAQTTLRSVIGGVELDEVLVNRDEINSRLQEIIDGITDEWGIKVTLVEVKDVELPESMRRAMARQAEAERDRRAKVIHAQGEFDAAKRLAEAAKEMATESGAMQLRLLSTLADVTAEKNSTLIFPVPMELLRFAESMTPARADGSDVDLSPTVAEAGRTLAEVVDRAGSPADDVEVEIDPGDDPDIEPTTP